MQQFNATHKRNGSEAVIQYHTDGTIMVKKADGTEKQVKENTIKRWYEIGSEIIPEEPKEKKQGDKRKKLTEQEVVEIREKFAEGQSKASLSREYKMSYSGIHWVCNRNTWADLEGTT